MTIPSGVALFTQLVDIVPDLFFDALVHILDGSAEIKISGKVFSLETGDAIVMPANEPHALKALTPFKMLLTMIRN